MNGAAAAAKCSQANELQVQWKIIESAAHNGSFSQICRCDGLRIYEQPRRGGDFEVFRISISVL